MRSTGITILGAFLASALALSLASRAMSQEATKAGKKPEDAPKAPAAKPSDQKVREFHLYTVDADWKFADGKSSYVMGYAAWDDNFGKAPEPINEEVKKKLSSRLTIPNAELRCKVGEH